MGDCLREQGPQATLGECELANGQPSADIHDGATGQVGQCEISPRFVGWPRLRQHATPPITTA